MAVHAGYGVMCLSPYRKGAFIQLRHTLTAIEN